MKAAPYGPALDLLKIAPAFAQDGRACPYLPKPRCPRTPLPNALPHLHIPLPAPFAAGTPLTRVVRESTGLKSEYLLLVKAVQQGRSLSERPRRRRGMSVFRVPDCHEVVNKLSVSPQLPASFTKPELNGGHPPVPGHRPIPGINRGVAAALAALESTGLPWMVLRGENDLLRPAGDVDILVAREAVPGLDSLLEGAGFRRVHAMGHGSHRFYFRYLPDEDLWLKLDVVSDLSFGPFQELGTALAEGCLRRRVPLGPLWLPEPHDQAWLQILHLVLDKGRIDPDREESARTAGVLASAADPVAAVVDRKVGDGAAAALLDMLHSGRFQEVPSMAAAMRARWKGNKRPPRLTTLAHQALRRVGPRLKGRGPVIGVLAPDGAGKTTLLHGLRSHSPLPSSYVYMGLWSSSPSDRWIPAIPGGVLARKMFRILRGGLSARYQSLRGRVVLLDRLAQDGMLGGGQAKSRLRRLSDGAALYVQPRPDLILVLDVPGEVMYARKGEHSPEVLEEWRNAYLELAAGLPAASVLDAGESESQVRRKASELLWQVVSGGAADGQENPDPIPLHLWMLLDWRFLLPPGKTRKLGYGGRVGKDAVAAISLLDPAARNIEPGACPAPAPDLDAVLLSRPEPRLLEAAAANLRPNGWMCIHAQHSFGPRSGPLTLAGWKRAMERLGFEDVSVYWHVPRFEGPERLVPTASVSAVRDTLAHYSGARFGRAKAAVAGLALTLGLFDIAAPAGTVIGRWPEAAPGRDPA